MGCLGFPQLGRPKGAWMDYIGAAEAGHTHPDNHGPWLCLLSLRGWGVSMWAHMLKRKWKTHTTHHAHTPQKYTCIYHMLHNTVHTCIQVGTELRLRKTQAQILYRLGQITLSASFLLQKVHRTLMGVSYASISIFPSQLTSCFY